MACGTVARWFAQGGFGFIAPDDGGPDVFVHIRRVSSDYDWDEIPKGTRVTYDVGEGRKSGSVEAKNVFIIERKN